MGGMHGFGPVVVPGCHDVYHAPWEGRVFAMSTLVGTEALGSGSGRAIREEMAPEHYLRASYYERWLWSTEQRLLRKGTIASEEVDGWQRRLEEGDEPPRRTDPDQAARVRAAISTMHTMASADSTRFTVGQRVSVRRMRPFGHTRCPRYVRGASGTIDAVRGEDRLPDLGPGASHVEPVYSVAFHSEELFGPSDEGSWTVLLDLSETYLEAA